MSARNYVEPSDFTVLELAKLPKGVAPTEGCLVKKFIAGATLLVGDTVYVSAANTVNKSTSVANYDTIAGVVVGGKSLKGIALSSTNVGKTAALNGEWVYVAYVGLVYAVADEPIAAAAKVGIGAAISTAGRLTDASPTAGRRLGTAVTAATNAGDSFLVDLWRH